MRRPCNYCHSEVRRAEESAFFERVLLKAQPERLPAGNETVVKAATLLPGAEPPPSPETGSDADGIRFFDSLRVTLEGGPPIACRRVIRGSMATLSPSKSSSLTGWA